MGDITQDMLSELCSMSEKDLQGLIIEPLLKQKGFRNVLDHSGPNERGKDLIATKQDDFGRHDLYAIQIKKFRPTSKAASTQGIMFLLHQLEQALNEPVVDPITHKRRTPDKCLFFTPYSIDMHVLDSALFKVTELEKQGLRIIDGHKLVEEVSAHLPSVLSSLSRETQYKLNFEKSVGVVRESSLAFGLTRDLDLDSIYVDMQLAAKGILIELLSFPTSTLHEKLFICSLEEKNELEKSFGIWMPGKTTIFSPPRTRPSTERQL